MVRRASAGSWCAIVATCVLLLSADPARAGWTLLQNGFGQNAGYFGISAVDAQHAMAVGTHDRGDGSTESVVASTLDGRTWTTQRPDGGVPAPMGMELYAAVEMTTADVAYVGAMAKLLVTNDGGSTWTAYVEDGWRFFAGPMITGISFAGASAGFFVGSDGTVRRTTDGGVSWTRVDPPVAGLDLAGVVALDANRVWVWAGSTVTNPDTGEVTGYEDGMLARSTDGGGTWQIVFQSEARAIDRVFMLNPNEGWMISNALGGPRLERTTNGGAAWSDMVVPSGGVGFPDRLVDVFLLDRCEAFLMCEVGEQTMLFYTTDRGSSWTETDLSGLRPSLPFPFPVPARLAAFDFPSRDVGFGGGFFESLVGYAADGPGPNCGGGTGDGGFATGSGESGCGCRTSGAPTGGFAVLLTVAGLVVRRRRESSCPERPSERPAR